MPAMMKLLHGTVANTIRPSPQLTHVKSKELDTDVVCDCDPGGNLLSAMYAFNLSKSDGYGNLLIPMLIESAEERTMIDDEQTKTRKTRDLQDYRKY